MFEISVKALNVDKLQRQFSFLGDSVPKWVALGMTQTAKQSKQAVQQAMPMHIDRPTPWTLRSLFFFPAEKDDLRAAVAFKWEFGRRSRREIGMIDAPASMRSQVYGEDRQLKGFEKTLQRAGVSPPGKPFLIPTQFADVDRDGNVKTAFINKVFYSGSRGGTANMQPFSRGAKRSRSRDARAGIRYFSHPNKKGIYRTIPHSNIGGGRGRSGVLPIFIFSDQPHYRSRFDFHGIASRGARNLESNVVAALDRGTQRYLKQ